MNFRKPWGLGALVAVALVASPALAQDVPDVDVDVDVERGARPADFITGVAVRGGLNTFTGELGDVTGAGTFLGVQAESRATRLVGVEVSYEGSRNPVENLDGGLWRHNVGALAKVGPTLGERTRPFVGAGLGLSYLNPSDDAEVLYDTDFATEVPLVAGVEYQLGGITAGARASYRILGGESLGTNVDGNVFNAGLSVGGRF